MHRLQAQRVEVPAGWRQGGFTLLEMIVVLAVLGLATALVLPSSVRGIESWKRQAEVDALLDQVRALPGEARGSGRAIVVSDEALAAEAPPLRVGPGWTLRAPVAWRVGANGVCQAGELRLAGQHGEHVVRVAAPFCDPQVVP